MNTSRKNLQRTVKGLACKYHKELQQHPHLEYKTIEGQRMREAVQQLMELADGQKDWVKSFLNSLPIPRRTNYPISFCRYFGGSPGHRGNPIAYGFKIRKLTENIYEVYYGMVGGFGTGD